MASAEVEPEVGETIAPPAFDTDLAELEGEVFVNPETGQKIRIVRRTVAAEHAPSE